MMAVCKQECEDHPQPQFEALVSRLTAVWAANREHGVRRIESTISQQQKVDK